MIIAELKTLRTKEQKGDDFMSSELQVRDFHCNNCGAPLDIPKNSKGKVVCPSCKTECVIEGLVKNAEIQAKENINSGIPLYTEQTQLNQLLVNILTSSPDMPLDLLEKAVVIKEEHICIPAYLYYCNGMAGFTYEAGNQREHKTAIDLGDRTRVEKEQYTEWTQMSSTASTTATLIASGNKEYSSIVKKLYMTLDSNQLVDIEDLDYPFDVQTMAYNLPQSAAFNEYVKPYMDSLLEQKAIESLNGKTYRNVTMGGSNVQKDEIIRVFLGLYHIVYQYNGKDYSVYVTGDGKNYMYDDVPVDAERQKTLQDKQASMNAVPNKHKWFMIGAIICAIAALFTMGITLIGTVVCIVFYVKFKKEYDSAQAVIQKDIDDFVGQVDSVKQQFMQKGQPLNGIYSINQ